jgi:hypothetical protein
MPKQPLEEYQITFGEKRDGMHYSARAYFFQHTPTGREQNITQCPFAKVLWSRGGDTDAGGTRIIEQGFAITQPIILKMVCMLTGFGNPQNRKYLYLNLDPTAERLKIVGLGNFGEFIGRATINLEKTGMDMKTIRENFSIMILAAPLIERSGDVRSLIY